MHKQKSLCETIPGSYTSTHFKLFSILKTLFALPLVSHMIPFDYAMCSIYSWEFIVTLQQNSTLSTENKQQQQHLQILRRLQCS